MLKAVVGERSVIYHKGKQHKRFCNRHAVIILVFIGFAFMVGGIVCAITEVFEDWVKDKIREGIKLDDGNEVFDRWLDSTTPTFMVYYVFHVKNEEEVSKGGKPDLQQLGPYTYRIVYNKTLMSRNKYTSSSITYLSQKYHIFVKERSCKQCDPMVDTVTTANLPLLTTIELLSQLDKKKEPRLLSFDLNVMNDIFRRLNLRDFHQLTVHELLWGDEDAALNEAHNILLALARKQDPTFNLVIPRKFTLQENESTTLYTLDSGDDDVGRVGEYLLWNNRSKMTCWNDKYANMMNGTGGERFMPFLSKRDSLYAVANFFHRSYKLIYDSIVYFKGIRLYRFKLDPAQFVTGDINPNNKGFCVTGKGKKCLKTGLLDISHCVGAPVIGSLPHFYLADRSLLSTVKGLNPQRNPHGTFLDVEPYTGLTMKGRGKLQINVRLRRIEGISAFNTTANVYLPAVYFEKRGQITDDDVDDFKDKVILPLRLSQAAPFMLIGIGAILWIIAGAISYYRHRKKVATSDERIPLIQRADTNYSGSS